MVMSCFGRISSDRLQGDKRSKAIQRQIDRDGDEFKATQKLLLLGEGGSGKSTIVKQMRILHNQGFSDAERTEKIENIRRNIRDAMLTIIGAMTNIDPPVQLADPSHEFRLRYLLEETTRSDFDYPPIFFEHIQILWNDAGIQECFQRSNEYCLMDCAKYFFGRIDEVRQPDYVPTDQDILHCRMLTTGVLETKFTVKKVNFHVFDVGGQRSERRQWIQCFGEYDARHVEQGSRYSKRRQPVLTAILFVSAMSSYDQVLCEDGTKNNLQESLDVFNFVWNNRFLQRISIILFLNKEDLLKEKLQAGRTRIENYFPEFAEYKTDEGTPERRRSRLRSASKTKEDAQDPDAEFFRARSFFRKQFLSIAVINKDDDRLHRCYPHYTCAVDTENIRRIFECCRDIIQRVHLEQYGLL